MWEGSLKSHFERNMAFLDFELDFGYLLDLEMVLKVIYGSHWGSQGCPLGVLGAGLDFLDFLHIHHIGLPADPLCGRKRPFLSVCSTGNSSDIFRQIITLSMINGDGAVLHLSTRF